MRVLIIGDNEILEGTSEEIISQLDYRAKDNHDEYMREFAQRYKLVYGNPLFYHDARTFINNLNGVFLKILEMD